MRLIDYLDRGAELAPDGPCVICGPDALSFSQVRNASYRIATDLRARGVFPGDIVATLGANSAEYLLAVMGVVRLGAVWLPLNVRYAEAELRHAIRSNSCSFAFSAEDQLEQTRATFRDLGLREDAVIDLSGVLAAAQQDPVDDADRIDPEQDSETLVAIRSTGGTTGPSKGVMICNRNYETLLANLFATLPYPDNQVHLAVAPLSHAAGTLAWAGFAHAGPTIVMPKFDPATVLHTIEAQRVTHMFLTPTMIYMLMDSPEVGNHDYSSLHTVIYSGAPMSVEKLKRAIEIFGPVFAQAYGQAEAPFFCTILRPEDHCPGDPDAAHRLASCGRPTVFTQVEIMNPEGQLLPNGERGEIVVRSDLVMKGYFNNPEATEKARRFGWHHTGDIGYKDADGFVYIVDRERDVIISGGFNIFPTEIEQVIWSHPAVQDCAVIGVPDELWGEAVKAVIETRPGATVQTEEIVALCAERLGRMKAPKSVDVWDSLPRSPVGKVLKREIRAKYWAGLDRAV